MLEQDATVEIGRPPTSIFLRPIERRGGDQGMPEVEVSLVGDGVRAKRVVHHLDRRDLSRFVAELARDWRGWHGARRWAPIDGDFTLMCHHDRIGHVVVEVELGLRPPREWKQDGWVVAATVLIDPGQLQVLQPALDGLLGAV